MPDSIPGRRAVAKPRVARPSRRVVRTTGHTHEQREQQEPAESRKHALSRGEFVPGLSQLDNQPQILAYAFLFGIAQQLVTRLVDRQAQDVLGKLPSKEPTSAKPEPPPSDQQTQMQGQPEQPRRIFPRRRLR
jgi:hypothetical protein